MNIIEANNLSVGYDDKIIIDNLNISIPKNKITVIIGPNGSGKSTLLKAIGRVLKPHNGSVLLNDEEILKLNEKDLAKKLTFLPQTPHAPEGLSIYQLVSYGRFPYQKRFSKSTSEDDKIIKWAIKQTGLEGLEDMLIDNLSGGQRQRAWIAMALAQKTDVILLDEPTTYLDLSYQLEVLEVLDKLNKETNCSIVLVLHDLNLAARFADHMIVLKDGKLLKAGSPNEIMEKDVLLQTFNIDANIVIDQASQKPVCQTYDLIKGEV